MLSALKLPKSFRFLCKAFCNRKPQTITALLAVMLNSLRFNKRLLEEKCLCGIQLCEHFKADFIVSLQIGLCVEVLAKISEIFTCTVTIGGGIFSHRKASFNFLDSNVCANMTQKEIKALSFLIKY